MNPEFSTIVPLYNQEKYIEECIQSVINQTFNNFELIIINDGSTDKSYEICEMFTSQDVRIKLYNKSNEGVSIARNLGIKYSTGKYLFFLDSDDWILPEHVERLVDLLEKNNSDASSCGFKEVRNDVEFDTSNKKWKVVEYTGKEFVYQMTRLTGYRCVPWGRLIRKEWFEGFSFPLGRRFEDVYAMPALMIKLNSVVYTNEPLYIYRNRLDSDIHSPFKISRTDELDGYINLTRIGLAYDCKSIIRNGALFFVLCYVRFKSIMKIKGMNTDAYIEKYRPYQKLYIRYFLNGKIKDRDLIYKELIPLR